LSHNVPVPSLGDDMILVKTAAVSVNPVDTKMVGGYVTPGSIAGCDFAGKVVAIGSAVKSIAIGDRVCGAVMGMNPLQPDVGAFAN
ncbi:chaperonin 10-like protein, partial [Apiosordaria backusii]